MVPSLAVINSRGASLQENVLTLTGVAPNSIVFADRPVRAAGHVLTSDFFKGWDSSFGKDPPNATVSVLSADGASVKDAVVVLKMPKLEGDKLSSSRWFCPRGRPVEGGRTRCALHRLGSRRAASEVGRSSAARASSGFGWHGAWYGHPGAALATGAVVGGAIGAAAAGAYGAYDPYYSSCGVYPYPPC